MNEDAFSQVLEKIYAVPLEQDLWPEALRAVSDLFGSSSAHFEVIDKQTCIPIFHKFDRLSEESLTRYAEHYSSVSPRTKDGTIRPAGYIGYDYSVLSEQAMAQDEFYEDFLRPQGLRYFVSGHMMNNSEYYGVFSVQRRIEEGHADKDELELMKRLLPHLSQAVQIQMKLAKEEDRTQGANFLVENSRTGVVFMDRKGQVLSMNGAADQVIADETNELDILQKRLVTGNRRQAIELDRLICDAIQTGTGQGERPGAGILLARLNALPLSLIAMPLPRRHSFLPAIESPVAVVLISDPSQSPGVSGELLRSLFGLTPAECRLAQALSDGQTPTDYAAKNNLSIRTVRTHLSNILHKTGTRTQVELMRLLSGTSQLLF
jgi:DNA-binding CsgD family transcriptional regulator